MTRPCLVGGIGWLVVATGVGLAGCGDSASSDDTAGAGAASGDPTGGGAATTGGDGSGGSDGATGGTGAVGGGGTAGSPGCGRPATAGETQETIDVGGMARTFVLAVPEGLDGRRPVPLIFGFHGFNGSAESASRYFGLTGAEPALYVYPQALPLGEDGVGWDMAPDGVDVAFIDALVPALATDHCVDTTRIFAAGHSHGASFSNHLGCYRPDLVRAIAPVAGGGPWAGRCTGSVSAMLTHGALDMDVEIQAGIDSRDHWLEANGCAGAPSAPADPAPCVAYAGCAEPVLWCEHPGGHEWPNFAGEGIRTFFLSF